MPGPDMHTVPWKEEQLILALETATYYTDIPHARMGYNPRALYKKGLQAGRRYPAYYGKGMERVKKSHILTKSISRPEQPPRKGYWGCLETSK